MHLGVIPDGNRRYAAATGTAAYRGGRDAMERLVRWFAHGQNAFTTLTVFCLSVDNWKRDRREVDGLFAEVREFYHDLIAHPDVRDEYVMSVAVVSTSHTELLPDWISAREIWTPARGPPHRAARHINLCVSYSGREDIAAAAGDPARFLVQPPEMDAVLRTSGEMRLSDFCPWHAAKAELVFVKKLWPDMHEKDFDAALEQYSKRNIRAGA
jgi:undecaprenyl diphosphate synthase